MIDLEGKPVETVKEEEPYKRKKVSLFDWLGDLNYDKKGLFSSETEQDFVPFMINRGMSQNMDTIMYANEMNKHWRVTKEMVHDFYLYIVPKKKRYGKWAKQTTDNKDEIELLMKHYNIGYHRAIEYLKLLSSEDIQNIKSQYAVGGKTK